MMTKQKIGVVDYEAGNLRSVETALEYLDAGYIVSANPEVLNRMDKIIFPGVGDAGASMVVLKRSGLGDFLKGWIRRGNYLLGICVGCQLLFEYSDERETPCLGVFPGKVTRFPGDRTDNQGQRFKVPHMGWNQVEVQGEQPLFKGIPSGASFYFVHSYYPDPAAPSEENGLSRSLTLGITDYIYPFTSAVGRDNVMATQFHPEKSGEYGLKLLSNFLKF